MVSTLAGSSEGFADGPGTSAKFLSPHGVAVDAAGNVYVADRNNHRIRKISPTGFVTTLAGSAQGFADGQGAAALFDSPTGVAVDAAGNVYVADYHNHRIRVVSPTGLVSTLAGSTPGYAEGQGAAAKFRVPIHLCLDPAGNVYVSDLGNNRIRKISPTGLVSSVAGGVKGIADGQGAAARFDQIQGIARDAEGNLYVADPFFEFDFQILQMINYDRIRKISPTGLVSTLAGSTRGYVDGPLSGAKFSFPTGVAVDASGTVYVADINNHKIRTIT